jgi:hypothetical protein
VVSHTVLLEEFCNVLGIYHDYVVSYNPGYMRRETRLPQSKERPKYEFNHTHHDASYDVVLYLPTAEPMRHQTDHVFQKEIHRTVELYVGECSAYKCNPTSSKAINTM